MQRRVWHPSSATIVQKGKLQSHPAPVCIILCLKKLDALMDWEDNRIYIDGQKNLAPFFCNNCADGCNAEPPGTFLQNSFVCRN